MPSAFDHPSPSVDSVSTAPAQRSSKKILTRNIDEVVLGNVCFPTWYYSPYPDDMILQSDDRTSRQSSHGDIPNGLAADGSHVGLSSKICSRLYVCPYCFRYTPVIEKYVTHIRIHQQHEKDDPATLPMPESASKVYEYGGYTVWEIDGEQEKLYCQNLSLFGKLFLEQKSVFYDTGGFLYFVLTYAPPEMANEALKPRRGRPPGNSHIGISLKTQVLGFFSKENPSWDSNNLACILVFPPYQHRQLGKLLMSVSYKLSAWEWDVGIIGGPEKPLSEMGRRSYLRFWSERIARFMVGESADADRKRVFSKKRRKNSAIQKEEMSVQEIGKRTGMLGEDVVAALTEMGVCETLMPKRKKKTSNDTNGITNTQAGEEDLLVTMTVKRSAILEWAKQNGVELEDPVKEEGFLGEWSATDEGELATDEPGDDGDG